MGQGLPVMRRPVWGNDSYWFECSKLIRRPEVGSEVRSWFGGPNLVRRFEVGSEVRIWFEGSKLLRRSEVGSEARRWFRGPKLVRIWFEVGSETREDSRRARRYPSPHVVEKPAMPPDLSGPVCRPPISVSQTERPEKSQGLTRSQAEDPVTNADGASVAPVVLWCDLGSDSDNRGRSRRQTPSRKARRRA